MVHSSCTSYQMRTEQLRDDESILNAKRLKSNFTVIVNKLVVVIDQWIKPPAAQALNLEKQTASTRVCSTGCSMLC
jgi:hypothetical protein